MGLHSYEVISAHHLTEYGTIFFYQKYMLHYIKYQGLSQSQDKDVSSPGHLPEAMSPRLSGFL